MSSLEDFPSTAAMDCHSSAPTFQNMASPEPRALGLTRMKDPTSFASKPFLFYKHGLNDSHQAITEDKACKLKFPFAPSRPRARQLSPSFGELTIGKTGRLDLPFLSTPGTEGQNQKSPTSNIFVVCPPEWWLTDAIFLPILPDDEEDASSPSFCLKPRNKNRNNVFPEDNPSELVWRSFRMFNLFMATIAMRTLVECSYEMLRAVRVHIVCTWRLKAGHTIPFIIHRFNINGSTFSTFVHSPTGLPPYLFSLDPP